MNLRVLASPMWLVLSVFAFHLAETTAQEKKKDPGDGQAPAAIQKSAVGTLLIREGPSKPWKHPALYDYVPTDKTLLAPPGARALLDLPKSGARLILWGNLPELSTSPVLESVATLHPAEGFDVGLNLERGRVMLENRREKGPVRARFQVGKDQLDVILKAPKSVVVLERFYQWAPGIPFVKKPKEPREGVPHLVVLVVKGMVETAFQGEKHTTNGSVLFHGTGRGLLEGPEPVKELPGWLAAGADQSEKTTAWHKAVEFLRRQLADKKSLVPALKAALSQDDPYKRSLAVQSGAALELWPIALAGLKDKSAQVRLSASRALHHQISRGSEPDIALYNALLESKFSPGQAEIAMELLHGFAGQSLARPETYETLINYLQHQQPAIRELAAWNLYSLVPQGKEIRYDASGPAADRARAQEAWRRLIPEGKLPPPRK